MRNGAPEGERGATGAESDLVFQGGGEMGERMRALDWRATSFGPPATWPDSLRSALALCLGARFPIAIYWGADFSLLYNDSWSPIAGSKHPWALARPGAVVWPELWDKIGPQFRQVLETGEAVRAPDELLLMHRHGYTEECYFDYSLNPIRDRNGRVGGVLNAVVETTQRVIGERRLRALRELAAGVASAETELEVCQAATVVLAREPRDMPFALLYLIDGETARLAAAAGIDAGGPASPLVISAADDFDVTSGWPVTDVARSGTGVEVADLPRRFGPLPGGIWRDSPDAALVIPIGGTGDGAAHGVLVAGVSPRRALDDDYRGFFELVAAQIATGVRNARSAQRARDALADAGRAQAALQEEEARMRALVLRTPAPLVLLTGPEHRIVLANDEFQRVSGTHRDLIGRTVREAFPELEGQPFAAALDEVWRTGVAWTRSEALVRYDPDGTGVRDTWFNLRYEPVRDADGKMMGILNFSVEVTSQVRARLDVERLLREAEAARAEAEAANRAKSDFLAVMSHELRTPLNAIGGYVDLMEMGIRGPVTAEQREDLHRIQTSQRHLLGLINEVLNYAKLETGTVQFEVAELSVGAALAAAEMLVAPQARAKRLTLTVTPCAADLTVRADAEKLRQVVVNLLSNAVKFTRSGGAIDVACVAREQYVDIMVRDTGIGIAPDKLEAIFEPFVQVRADLTRTAEGTGLGLAISRDLARGMGGDLTAESRVDEGSTFTLTLLRTTPDTGD